MPTVPSPPLFTFQQITEDGLMRLSEKCKAITSLSIVNTNIDDIKATVAAAHLPALTKLVLPIGMQTVAKRKTHGHTGSTHIYSGLEGLTLMYRPSSVTSVF